jgi:hypothetical protein
MCRTLSETVRWVVLHHTGVAEPHFDLMYEENPDGLLTTWRVPEWPVRQYVLCTELGVHRHDYLEYEGRVSQDRGEVHRVAAGMCRVETLLTRNVAIHIELWNRNDDPFFMLERYEEGWTAVPLDPESHPVGQSRR